MIKTDNLYAEVVINESPFYYDEHGRLRARVLTEEQSLNELSMRGPEAAPTVQNIGLAPMPKPKQDDEDPEEKKLRDEFNEKTKGNMWAMDMPTDPDTGKPTSRRELAYKKFKQEKTAKKGGLTPMPEKQPGVPVEKTDMPEPPVRGGVPAKQKPGLGAIIGGIKRPGIGGIRRPETGGNGRTADQSIDLPRPGMRRALPALPPSGKRPDMRINLPITGRPVLGGIDIDRGNTPPVPPTRVPGSPRMGTGERSVPPSGRATIDQGFAPGEEQGRGVARPAVGVKRPGKPLRSFRFSRGSTVGAGRNTNTRAGLRGAPAGNQRAYALEEGAVLATDYIEEKMDLKNAEMGDVIKDFQKSDAPQFKGKSPEKRRIMAIAAKLQADRGTK